MKRKKRVGELFLSCFIVFFNEFMMNAESLDLRSTRKKPGKSWGGAFFLYPEIHCIMIKIRKNVIVTSIGNL